MDDKSKPAAMANKSIDEKAKVPPAYEGGACPRCGQTLSLMSVSGNKLWCGNPVHIFYPG